MATRPKKISVSVTAGRNAPVNHVLRLEDLLLQLQPAPAKARRTHAAAPAGSVPQLATELGQRLREARAAATPPPRAGRRAK
ncbi:MAG: hypothetical protein U1F53_08335 [Burkholderiaceae bacterium]